MAIRVCYKLSAQTRQTSPESAPRKRRRRMTRPRNVLAGILLVAWVVAAAAGQNQANQFDGVALTTAHAGGKVYMVQRPGGGGNVGMFVGPDGVLLVDSLFAPLADRLVAAVRQVTDREI